MAKKFYKEDNEAIPAIVYQETAPAGFSEITDADEVKSRYIKLYEQREVDGKDYFDKMRSDLVYDYATGVKTDAEIYEIETKLESVILKIKSGDWMTASAEMTNNVTVSGALTQALYDQILGEINNYVATNY